MDMQKLFVGIGAIAVVMLIAGAMWGLPLYRVWASQQAGRAQLAQAEYFQQVIAVEARARLQAEIYNAQAEVARARGAAQAMYEVRDALSEEYILYLWVRLMAGNPNVIYIATEGSLPILEVNRRTQLRP